MRDATEGDINEFIAIFKASDYPDNLKSDYWLRYSNTPHAGLAFGDRDMDHIWQGFKLARQLK